MLGLKQVHHIAIIATDYAKSKAFYCDILGFTLLSEAYRVGATLERRSGVKRAVCD